MYLSPVDKCKRNVEKICFWYVTNKHFKVCERYSPGMLMVWLKGMFLVPYAYHMPTFQFRCGVYYYEYNVCSTPDRLGHQDTSAWRFGRQTHFCPLSWRSGMIHFPLGGEPENKSIHQGWGLFWVPHYLHCTSLHKLVKLSMSYTTWTSDTKPNKQYLLFLVGVR